MRFAPTLSLTFLYLILQNTIQDMEQVSMFFRTIEQLSLDLYHLIPGLGLPSVKQARFTGLAYIDRVRLNHQT